jgi:hypothetical protein
VRSWGLGHNKIHHRYDNGLDDMHTNLDLDRSRNYSLLLYMPRFFLYWSGFSCFFFFLSRQMWSLAWRMGLGVVVFHGVLLAICYHDWTFGLPYAVYPDLESNLFLGRKGAQLDRTAAEVTGVGARDAGLISYLWHAWMDPKGAAPR